MRARACVWPDSEPDPKSESEPEPDPKPELDTKPEPKFEPEREPEPKPDPESTSETMKARWWAKDSSEVSAGIPINCMALCTHAHTHTHIGTYT